MPVIMKENVQYAYTDKGIKAHTLSYAEYQALSTEEKMNGDLYFIPDKQPEGNPSLIWDKLGTATLDTDADNVSDAINEHEEDISKLISNVATLTNNFVFVAGESSDANSLFTNGYYRNTSGIIRNCPANDGHLIVLGKPDLHSKVQLYISSNSVFYVRNAWGAGSTSFTDSCHKITTP
jgi:hypothetical protein